EAAPSRPNDATPRPSAPSSPAGAVGAVQFTYQPSCTSSSTCVYCPPQTTSVSYATNGSSRGVQCLVTDSNAVELGSWLPALIGFGFITSSTPMQLTAWGGKGGFPNGAGNVPFP